MVVQGNSVRAMEEAKDTGYQIVQGLVVAVVVGYTLKNIYSYVSPTVAQQDAKKTMKKSDYVGDIPEEINDILAIFKDANNLKKVALRDKLKVELPRGYLLSGKPGVGKTLLASVIAGELDCPFFALDASKIRSSFWGEDEKKMHEVFDAAEKAAQKHKNKTAVLFIDEIDTIARSRAASATGFASGALTALLTRVDGFGYKQSKQEPKKSGYFSSFSFFKNAPVSIIVIGATNLPEELDEALLSRFDGIIEVKLPKVKKLQNLLEFYTKGLGVPVADNVSFQKLAQKLQGMSGRNAESIARAARMHAYVDDSEVLRGEDFTQAIESNKKKLAVAKKKKPFLSDPRFDQGLRSDISENNVVTADNI